MPKRAVEGEVDASLFQRAVEQARDYAVFLLSPEGRIMTWNVGAERIKGYAREEIIGQHFSVFYPREAVDAGWPEHELRVATAEGRFEDEGWRVRSDGSRFWANVIITALRDEDGRLLGFSKITRDLTQRRQYETALRQSEERFRLLVEGVADYAIYMLDPEGFVSSWNAGAERIKGYAPDEIIGRHFSRFYPPEDVDAGKPWETLATARREGRAEDEGWRVRQDGERFWARVVVSALHDSEGRLRGFAKVTQDLTERRHAQDLEKAAKNVNEFIAMLAHELRNPLAPIRTAIELLGKSGDAERARLLQTLDRQSAHLARIVDDMIDISRITRGSLAIEHLPVDLAEVVRRAVEMATPAIEAARHRLQVDLPPGALRITGDLHRLTQLVANVLNNSARYTPEGGSISVSARAEGAWAVLTVTDTGRGIESQVIERIFDMFVQGRAPLQRVGGGLGVGLALARRIAELHGGTLEARSEGPGRGSAFTLRMPLAQEAAADAEGRGQAALRSMLPRRVLVVDDNVDAATTLSLLLKSLGHETCVVHAGTEALRAAVDFRPDVVLLDIGLPGLDGYEVARRLRSLSPDHPFRIVAITGWGQEGDRRRAQEAGFDLHLVKPVGMEDLARALGSRDSPPTLH